MVDWGENGGRDKERKSSLSSCVQTRVACGLRILHGNLALVATLLRFIRPCHRHSHVTTPLRVPENTPSPSPAFHLATMFTATRYAFSFSPRSGDRGIDANFFLSFFRPGDGDDRGD